MNEYSFIYHDRPEAVKQKLATLKLPMGFGNHLRIGRRLTGLRPKTMVRIFNQWLRRPIPCWGVHPGIALQPLLPVEWG